MRFERGGAAVRHQKLARLAARLGDAIRERRGEIGRPVATSHGWPRHHRRNLLQPTVDEPSRLFGARRTLAVKTLDAGDEINVVAAQAALDEQNRDFRREPLPRRPSPHDKHAGKTRRQRERAYAARSVKGSSRASIASSSASTRAPP